MHTEVREGRAGCSAHASSEQGLQCCPAEWRSGSCDLLYLCGRDWGGTPNPRIWSSGRSDIQLRNSPDAVTTNELIEPPNASSFTRLSSERTRHVIGNISLFVNYSYFRLVKFVGINFDVGLTKPFESFISFKVERQREKYIASMN